MKLFKWNLSEIKPKFPNIVEKFFGKKITDNANENEGVSVIPSVNIANAEKAFEVSVALPGIDKKDVKIEIQDHCLIVSSEKQYEKEEKDKDWMRREYGYASFQRIFQLPEGANHEKVQAEMNNGVLTIKVAKKEGFTDKGKKVLIQ
jgi:HSP20 family protein